MMTIPLQRIKNEGLDKRELAEKCIPIGINFDMALPQPWLDAFSAKSNFSYHEILATTFTLYKADRSIFGQIWSACAEIQREIEAF